MREKRLIRFTWHFVGDGNNVCNSLLLAAALVGMDLNCGRTPCLST